MEFLKKHLYCFIEKTKSKLYKKWSCYLKLVAIFLVLVFVYWIDIKYPDKINIAYKDNDGYVVAELNNHTILSQTMLRPVKKINKIGIKFVTFARENRSGDVIVRIYSNGKIVAEQEINVTIVTEDEYVYIDLVEKYGEVGEQMKIEISSNSKSEECIGICAYNSFEEMTPSINIINEINDSDDKVEKTGTIPILFEYDNINHKRFGLLVLFLVTLLALRFYILNEKIKHRHVYVSLFLLAMCILILRSGILTHQDLIAEDSVYLNDIISGGFIKNCINPRRPNFASYMYIYLGWCINKIIYGYSLEKLALIVQLISCFAYSFYAVLIYFYALKISDKKMLPLVAYICFLLIPTGTSGYGNDLNMYIWGKPLNQVYIYPLILIFVLIYKSRFYELKSLKLLMGEVLVFICCFSFAVSFGILFVYLIYMRGVDRNTRKFLRGNAVEMVVFLVGLLMSPKMIFNVGSADGLKTKLSEIIEFAIERHCIYPFVYNLYGKLNDWIVVILFLSCILIIICGVVMDKTKIFFLFVTMGGVQILGSIIMRLPMSALFDSYNSTGPDNYYYGCNICFSIMVIWGTFIVTKKIDYQMIIAASLISLWLINPRLICDVENAKQYIIGADKGVDDWKDVLETIYYDGDKWVVVTHPYTDDIKGKNNIYLKKNEYGLAQKYGGKK